MMAEKRREVGSRVYYVDTAGRRKPAFAELPSIQVSGVKDVLPHGYYQLDDKQIIDEDSAFDTEAEAADRLIGELELAAEQLDELRGSVEIRLKRARRISL